MLDALITMFGPQLAKALFSKESDHPSEREIIAALQELATDLHQLRQRYRLMQRWLWVTVFIAVISLLVAMVALKPGWFPFFGQ